jgi:hypothetical protein
MYKENPLAFIRDVIGASPTDQQIDLILAAVGENSRVAVKSCTSSGKTAVLAWLTLFFLSATPIVRCWLQHPQPHSFSVYSDQSYYYGTDV